MKKDIKKKKRKKSGFTLVELLAVIIILAIVVGITIPAVLTTTSNAKAKAFQTAANSVADWVDRQYQVYTTGLDSTGVATLDENFSNLCIRTCNNTNCSNGRAIGSRSDYYQANDTNPDKCNCNCDARIIFRLTKEFITAAGLKEANIKIAPTNNSYVSGFRVQKLTDGGIEAMYIIDKSTTENIIAMPPATSLFSQVYINPETGRSCVTLKAEANGDYPSGKIVCGGTCQSTNNNIADYCKAT